MIDTDKLACGLIALQHQAQAYKQRISHHQFLLENRIKLRIETKDVQDDLIADTFNLQCLEAVTQAASKVLHDLTSTSSVSVAE